MCLPSSLNLLFFSLFAVLKNTWRKKLVSIQTEPGASWNIFVTNLMNKWCQPLKGDKHRGLSSGCRQAYPCVKHRVTCGLTFVTFSECQFRYAVFSTRGFSQNCCHSQISGLRKSRARFLKREVNSRHHCCLIWNKKSSYILTLQYPMSLFLRWRHQVALFLSFSTIKISDPLSFCSLVQMKCKCFAGCFPPLPSFSWHSVRNTNMVWDHLPSGSNNAKNVSSLHQDINVWKWSIIVMNNTFVCPLADVIKLSCFWNWKCVITKQL